MSENLDLVRSIFAAWERGDFSSAEWAYPEIEFVLAGGVDDGTWTGVVGMGEGFRQYVSAWDELHAQAEEYRELDDERVLVLVRMSGRGRISGVEMSRTNTVGGALFRLRDGMVSRLVLYATTDRALADLGLKE
jgi:ketosteroid isomerase-like protein